MGGGLHPEGSASGGLPGDGGGVLHLVGLADSRAGKHAIGMLSCLRRFHFPTSD